MSSIVFFGLSAITFVIMYGVAFLLMPMVTGAFFSSIDPNSITSNSAWLAMYSQNEDTVKYLVPLMPSFEILIIVIKILMVSSASGRE